MINPWKIVRNRDINAIQETQRRNHENLDRQPDLASPQTVAPRRNSPAAQAERTARANATRKSENERLEREAKHEAAERKVAEAVADRDYKRYIAEAAERKAARETMERNNARRILEEAARKATENLAKFQTLTPEQQSICGNPQGDIDALLQRF